MSGTHTVLYDPHGLVEADFPLGHAPYEALVVAVRAWKDSHVQPATTSSAPSD
ncbi:hypothetical protein AB0C95_36085 [Streptomyces caniferus]|uniref:hypothetical protein n=1 Tax=Streptomyces caniferus TaxID=285557 RepID=UPI0033EACBE3